LELAERDAKVKTLFLQARELPKEEVCSFLDGACSEMEVRRQVERLLANDVIGAADLLGSGVATGEASRYGALREMPAEVGSYRLVRKLGEGGMGAVFEAEQRNPKRLVALKVMHGGRFASDYGVRLFQREIQALARLRHAGIAHIHEAGCTEEGHHYFTMELVAGETLSAYLKRCKPAASEVIAIFLKICDAVTYAHQHGVIHRDLKPSNIMVQAGAGAVDVKVLDFGLARVHDEVETGEVLTRAGAMQGTLPYMSPEQVSGNRDEVDLRSDVYALGVILYQMLAGRLPLDLSSLSIPESVRKIREEQPVALRKVTGLDADLCTIVHKALEKEAGRRYASASALSDDLHRYLSHEPIQARPASAWYELKKLVVRRRVAVGFAAVLLVVIVAFAVSAILQARRIAEERDRAVAAERIAREDRGRAMEAEAAASQQRNRAMESETRAVEERNRAVAEKKRADVESETAKAISEFLQNDLLAQAQAYSQATPNTRPDPNLPVRTALERAASKIEGRFAKQPEVEAAIRYTIGTTQWNLGLLPAAAPQLEKALEIRRRVLGERHLDTLTSMNALGLLYFNLGKPEQAQPLLERTLELRTQMLGEDDASTSVTMNNLGRLYRTQGKMALAEKMYSRALQIRKRQLGEDHPSTAVAMNNLGFLYYTQGKYQETEPLYLRSFEIRRRVLGEEHPQTSTARLNMGLLHFAQGRYAEAETWLWKAYETRKNGFGEAHGDTQASMLNLALCYLVERKLVEADALLSRLIETGRGVSSAAFLADAKVVLADVRVERRMFGEAEAVLGGACGAGKGWVDFYCRSVRGAALMGVQKFAEAEGLLVSGYEGLVAQKNRIPPERQFHVTRVGALVVALYQVWGKKEAAEDWIEKVCGEAEASCKLKLALH